MKKIMNKFNVQKRKTVMLLIAFFIAAGFLLGIFFLFFINNTVEAVLSRAQIGQGNIDLVMRLIILLWAVSAVTATFLFYKRFTREESFQRLAVPIIIILFIISAGVFYMLLSTGSDLMAIARGVVFKTEEGFTFGPYPDENELTMLKKEGYDGVITLLSPSVPFEKILLEKEIQAGEKVGLRIYSFPMLPWISENKDSIEKIKEFVKTNQGKFYVHCYLGKHRTNMVRQIIKTEFGGPVTNKEFVYPEKLERGQLLSYQNNRVFLGPYPTDDEWQNIILGGEMEVIVSYLDPDNKEDLPWMQKEQKICENLNFVYKNIPVKTIDKKVAGVEDLISYIQANNDKKIYIHGFITDERNRLIDERLKLLFNQNSN